MLSFSERDIFTPILHLLGTHNPPIPHISSGWRGAISSRKTYTGVLSQTTCFPTLTNYQFLAIVVFIKSVLKFIQQPKIEPWIFLIHSELQKKKNCSDILCIFSAIEETGAGNNPPNSNKWTPSSTYKEHLVCDVSLPRGRYVF